jgi:UDPglucose 6-dehydrogenase
VSTIAVVGTGYVGLVTGTCFADLGNDVVCIDIDERKIAALREGVVPIYEPGLEELVARNARAGRLRFTTSYAEALPPAEFCFITVDTPAGSNGEANMSAVRSAARMIGEAMRGHTTIINKSTMPIGSGDLVASILAPFATDEITFDVVSNPEFLREGSAVADFMHPDRVVLGSITPAAAERVAELYMPLGAPILITDLRTAEMIKYASNAFLATRISFINEVAQICERLGADVRTVAEGMGLDKRIGRHFLDAGIGFGGSCFEGDETVFALNSPNVAVERLATLFERAGAPFRGDAVEVITPAEQRVLAFDLDTGRPVLAEVKALTRRPYRGTMVAIRTSMGRSLRVTADHPVILQTDGGFAIVPAIEVVPGDQLMALCDLPPVEPAESLNLIELLRGSELADEVYVAAGDGSFAAQYARFAPYIPIETLCHPWEIKRHNRMPLRLFYWLTEQGVLDVPADRLQLSTAKGTGARINALIPVDADCLRLCGYYLAEGSITQDRGWGGKARSRIGFSFHQDEVAYRADVQRILARWGLAWSERRTGKTVTTVVSSRLLAWLLRDVLKCGTRSADKALPRLAFNVAPALRRELIRGAFSGDGAVTLLQQGQNAMFEYATVSKALADGLALLLQTVGVMPALYQRWMNKSTQPAIILRVSGYAQLAALRDILGDKHRARIDAVLAGYQGQIRPHGYARREGYTVLTVQEVAYEEVATTVYSLETSTGTVIASSGLICHNCFPKDVKALAYMAEATDCHPQLLNAVLEINEAMRRRFVLKVERMLGELHGTTIGAWGLAFKPDTDDMREAPALDILKGLLQKGARVRAYDPVAMENARRLLPEVEYVATPYEAAKGADAVVLLTHWNEFKQVDLGRVARLMRRPVLVDGRNLYDPAEARRHGLRYAGVGRC